MAPLNKHVIANTGCWHYLGKPGKDGYGKIKIKGKTLRAHRVYYEAYVGPMTTLLGVVEMSKYVPGIGCHCCAHSENECCCPDVDWRSTREVELEAAVAAKDAEIERLKAERGESQFCAGCNAAAKTLEQQASALKLARDALTDWLTTDLDEQQCWQALAAIDALEGEAK